MRTCRENELDMESLKNLSNLKLNSIVVDNVNEFLSSLEYVKRIVVVDTLVIRTTYGSRVFLKIKRKNSSRSLFKAVVKVGNSEDLQIFHQLLSALESMCSSLY